MDGIQLIGALLVGIMALLIVMAILRRAFHLEAILKDKRIIVARKEANRVFYRVGDIRMLRLIEMMRDLFCHRPG